MELRIPVGFIVFLLWTVPFLLCTKVRSETNCVECVMTPGMVIDAKTTAGSIKIEASGVLKRIYTWNSNDVEVELIPRRQRWNGSFGAYHPGGERKVHTVVEEGQQHFYSQDEILDWLSLRDNGGRYVYTDDGLAVWWNKTKGPGKVPIALSVKVWQFYVQGEKPKNLQGAAESDIDIRFIEDVSRTTQNPGDFRPSPPQNINGIQYLGKALDLMKEKGISTQQVQNCITDCAEMNDGEYTVFQDTVNLSIWIKLDQQNRVVQVGK